MLERGLGTLPGHVIPGNALAPPFIPLLVAQPDNQVQALPARREGVADGEMQREANQEHLGAADPHAVWNCSRWLSSFQMYQ